jgi:geranylgeranyl diphosphate synthase type II
MTTAVTSTRGLNITERLSRWAGDFERTLVATIAPERAVPGPLAEAVRYSVESGGKRVRPYILTRCCELCGGTAEQAVPAAVAIECVHAFSLVHDDLPAMDDDDLRRGRPTCHKAYGEAMAILAGDALLALAFELLSTKISEPSRAVAAVTELARGTGWAGMIGGQAIDILGEDEEPNLETVQRIHRFKTARLFESSARLGAISAGADDELIRAASEYGRQIGLAFQIADDLLDVTGDVQKMGKAVAKDADAGKQTYPTVLGLEESRRIAGETAQAAVDALDVFGPSADDLRELARFVVDRKA